MPAQNNVFIPKQSFSPPPHQWHPPEKRWQVVGCAENENEIEVIIHHPCAIVARGKTGDDGDGVRFKVTDGTLTGSGEVAVL